MSISRVTAKQFRLFVKEGETLESLQERFSCTEEEIEARLEQIYHRSKKEVQGIMSDLKANRKKPHRKSGDIKIEPKTVTTKDVPGEEIKDNGKDVDVKITEIENEKPETNTEKKEAILRLAEKEQNLSDEVISLEVKHKELAQCHHAQMGDLRKLQEEIENIKSALQDCHDKYETIVRDANRVAEEMNSISQIRRERITELESVRQEIKERRKITIFVYRDGSIEAPDNPDFVVNDEGSGELKLELSERKECQDLRVRDITTLARLLKATERDENLAPEFEDEKLEEVYKAISASR